MLSKEWKILNPKQHFFFLEKRKPVLKEKIIVSLVKLSFLKKGLFLSFGFWYLILFSISDLEFRIYAHKILSNYRR